MPVQLLSGPGGSGKTSRALSIFRQHSREAGFDAVRYLVPTHRQAGQMRRLLLDDPSLPGLFATTVCTFFDFAEQLAAKARFGTKRISDLQQQVMLEAIIAEKTPACFAAVARFPGFVRRLGAIIGELKLAMVEPGDLERRAARMKDPAAADRARGVATLYGAYHEGLRRHHLHDGEGVLWSAQNSIAEDPDLLDHLRCVVLDGFDEYPLVQRAFIEGLAGRVPLLVVTMDDDSLRPDLFGTAEDSKSWLRSLPSASEECLSSTRPLPPALEHVVAHIFDAEAPRLDGDESVSILTAAGLTLEAETIAREIRRLRREVGHRYQDFAILTRDRERYQDCVPQALVRYGIPVASDESQLRYTGLARFLAHCLEIVAEGWPRAAVTAALKSGYLPCVPDDACAIDLDARRFGKLDGRETWLGAWGGAEATEQRKAALDTVVTFFDAMRKARDAGARATAVRALLHAAMTTAGHPSDAAAYRALDGVLTDIASTERLLEKPFDAQEFFRLLRLGMEEASVSSGPAPADAVQLLAVDAVGGQKFKVVFVCGLVEKQFPRQVREDPFFRDDERRRMALSERLPAQARERRLFQRAAGTATERLYLTYPFADSKGQDALPSFYLAEVERLFTPGTLSVRRVEATQAVPPLVGVESERELIASLTSAFRGSHGKDDWPLAAAIYNALPEANRRRVGEIVTAPARPEATLKDGRITAQLAARRAVYSPSALETYAGCPYRYFCEETLGLSEVRDEVGGLERGRLFHDALRHWYLAEGKRSASEILDEVWRNEPLLRSLPPYEAELEKRVLGVALERFLAEEEALRESTGLIPSRFELCFGVTGTAATVDAASTKEPLRLKLPDAGEIEVRGRMDRVDLDPDGAAGLVIDYKTSRVPRAGDFDEGVVLQAPLYALALEQVFGLRCLGAEYRSVTGLERRGTYRADIAWREKRRDLDTQLANLEKTLDRLVSDMRKGRIDLAAESCDFCPYANVCQVEPSEIAARREEAESE
jgi:ATP-dependent helicase/nuclease subunit B